MPNYTLKIISEWTINELTEQKCWQFVNEWEVRNIFKQASGFLVFLKYLDSSRNEDLSGQKNKHLSKLSVLSNSTRNTYTNNTLLLNHNWFNFNHCINIWTYFPTNYSVNFTDKQQCLINCEKLERGSRITLLCGKTVAFFGRAIRKKIILCAHIKYLFKLIW